MELLIVLASIEKCSQLTNFPYVNPKHRCPLFSNSQMSPFGFVRFP